jgi:hypothetical protein
VISESMDAAKFFFPIVRVDQDGNATGAPREEATSSPLQDPNSSSSSSPPP